MGLVLPVYNQNGNGSAVEYFLVTGVGGEKSALDCTLKKQRYNQTIHNGNVAVIQPHAVSCPEQCSKYHDRNRHLLQLATSRNPAFKQHHYHKIETRDNEPTHDDVVYPVVAVFHVEIDETEKLLKILSGDYSIEKRILLDVEVLKNGESKHYLAVNDAVIARGQLSKIIDLHISLDGEKIAKYRADGLLFATPTGKKHINS